MKRYLRQHKGIAVVLCFGVFLALSWFWSLSAQFRGYVSGYIDVHRGEYRVLGYGLPAPSRSEYARCLRERYNIEFRPVAGCIVSDSVIAYVEGYHSMVTKATQRKFGHDVFKECAEEADRRWTLKETLQRTETTP